MSETALMPLSDRIALGALTRLYYGEVRRRGTFMYAIQAGDDGPVKLGITQDPAQRIKTLQTANPHELRGLAAWRILPEEEKAIHQQFAHARIRGEWFQPVPDLLDFVLWEGGIYCDWTKE